MQAHDCTCYMLNGTPSKSFLTYHLLEKEMWDLIYIETEDVRSARAEKSELIRLNWARYIWTLHRNKNYSILTIFQVLADKCTYHFKENKFMYKGLTFDEHELVWFIMQVIQEEDCPEIEDELLDHSEPERLHNWVLHTTVDGTKCTYCGTADSEAGARMSDCTRCHISLCSMIYLFRAFSNS